MVSLLWLTVLAFARLASSLNSQDKNIYLLAGQSNMAGQGGVMKNKWDGVVPPECSPNPSILRLDPNLTWVKAQEPLHAGIDVNVSNGIGPGMPFANALLSNDTSFGVIGLVPCAITGTKIIQWAQGSDLYSMLVRRARTALQGGGTIRALLWYQGESDTPKRVDADAYKGRLEKFITDLRGDLQLPLLPVIQVALASGNQHYIDIVRAAQLGTNLTNVICIDAKGLPLQSDNLHLTTPSQVRLGKMLADAFLQTSWSFQSGKYAM